MGWQPLNGSYKLSNSTRNSSFVTNEKIGKGILSTTKRQYHIFNSSIKYLCWVDTIQITSVISILKNLTWRRRKGQQPTHLNHYMSWNTEICRSANRWSSLTSAAGSAAGQSMDDSLRTVLLYHSNKMPFKSETMIDENCLLSH